MIIIFSSLTKCTEFELWERCCSLRKRERRTIAAATLATPRGLCKRFGSIPCHETFAWLSFSVCSSCLRPSISSKRTEILIDARQGQPPLFAIRQQQKHPPYHQLLHHSSSFGSRLIQTSHESLVSHDTVSRDEYLSSLMVESIITPPPKIMGSSNPHNQELEFDKRRVIQFMTSTRPFGIIS